MKAVDAMKLFGIIRVSTDEQAGPNGEGLERQRHSLRGIAKATGADLQMVEVKGVSGSDLAETPQWRDTILPAINAGAHVAADSLDRVIRADGFDLTVLMAVRKAGGRIYLPGLTYDLSDARDVLTVTLFAGLGGYDKAELKRKMQDGKERKREAGCWVNRLSGLPLGIWYEPKARVWGYTSGIERVREAFRLFVHEGLTTAGVARHLCLKGKAASAKAILTNEIYKGILVFDEKRGEKYASKDGKQADRRRVRRNPDEVIRVRVFPVSGPGGQAVSDALWDAAQERIRGTQKMAIRRRERTAPGMYLTGHLFSAYEWQPRSGFVTMAADAPLRHVVYGESGGPSKPVRYACRCKSDLKTDPNAPRPRCDLHYLHADDVNLAVDEYLRAMTTEGRVIARVRTTFRDAQRDNAGRDAAKARLDADIKKLDTRERNAKEMREDGTYTRDEFRDRMGKINADRQAVQDALSRLADTTPAVTPADLDHLSREWAYDPSWTPDRKRAWIAKYVPEISISNEGVEAVTVRIPGSNCGNVPIAYVPSDPRTWVDLLGYDPTKAEGRLSGAGHLVAGQVAERLGVTIPRITYLVRIGVFPTPTGPMWGLKKTWTEADVATYQKILPTITDRRCKITPAKAA